MNSNAPIVIETLWQRLAEEIKSHALSRMRDVARGAETPELAGLLVEKYGMGLAKAAALAADVFDVPAPDLTRDVDKLVAEIDPDAKAHREKRWAQRPAGLTTVDQ